MPGHQKKYLRRELVAAGLVTEEEALREITHISELVLYQPLIHELLQPADAPPKEHPSNSEIVVQTMVREAKAGNMVATGLIFDRIYGKIKATDVEELPIIDNRRFIVNNIILNPATRSNLDSIARVLEGNASLNSGALEPGNVAPDTAPGLPERPYIECGEPAAASPGGDRPSMREKRASLPLATRLVPVELA